MTCAQRRNHLTHFSEHNPVVKRRISVFPNTRIRGVIPLRLHTFLHLIYRYVNLLSITCIFANEVHSLWITTVFPWPVDHNCITIAYRSQQYLYSL